MRDKNKGTSRRTATEMNSTHNSKQQARFTKQEKAYKSREKTRYTRKKPRHEGKSAHNGTFQHNPAPDRDVNICDLMWKRRQMELVNIHHLHHLPQHHQRIQYQLLHNPFREQPNPHEPRRIHLLPYLHRRTSERMHV